MPRGSRAPTERRRRLRRGAFLAFASLFATACAASSTPRIRVARDLGCTADRTDIVRIDENRWQVTGCGRTAVYLCTYPVRDCWREGAIHTAGERPVAPVDPVATVDPVE